MASVINSARKSTASMFDFVGTSAEAANQLVSVAGKGIDALHVKTEIMHSNVVRDAKIQKLHADEDAVTRAARDRTRLLEEIHREFYSDRAFDKTNAFETSLDSISKALKSDDA